MTNSFPVVAWQVLDASEGDACIIFHAHSVAARREGASELGCEFKHVTCRRAKMFDRYADLGEVPALALLEAGWRFECTNCGQLLYSENEGTPLSAVVERDDWVYCCAQCRDEHELEISGRNASFEKFKAIVTAARPDLTFSSFTGAYPYVTRTAKFTFPRAKYGGAVRDQDGDGNLQWFIAAGDQLAWEEYDAHRTLKSS